jgi:plastocyanin
MRRHDGNRVPKAVAPALAVLVLVVSACGGDDDLAAVPVSGGSATSETTRSTSAAAEELVVNAEDIAFDVDRIEVAVGEAVTVTFNNNDTDIPHNFHVEAGGVDAKTDIAPGPDTQTLEFTIDEAGNYTFICDVHPQMTGALVAS